MCGRFDAPGERQSTAAASTENEKDMQLPEKEATGGRVTAPPPFPRHEARSPRLITYDRRHYCHNHNRNKSLVMAFAKSYPALSNPAFRAEHEKATHDLSRPALGGARPGKRHLLPQRSRPLAVLDRINVVFSSHDVETSQLRMKTYLVYCCSFPIL